MMYSSPGQPLPGATYGGPPTGGYGAPPTGSYGAPPTGGQYTAPLQPYQAPPPPTDMMAGMSIGQARAPLPGGSSQFQPPPSGGHNFRHPAPTYHQGPPPGGNFPGSTSVPQPHVPPHSAPPPTNFGGPLTSGHAPTNYGQPPISGQHLGHPSPPPVSGHAPMGYGPPPPISGQPSSQPGGYGQSPSGQVPPMSHAPLSGHAQPPGMLGQPPPPTSGQAPPMSHAQHPGMLGQPPPPTAGQAPPMSHAQHPGMFGQPPSSGQVMPPRPGMLAGPPSSGQMYGPPMHPTAMHGGPPPTGPPFMSGGPAPPRGPQMVPPPGSPGGPMSAPPGGMVQQPPRTRIDPEQMPNPVAMMRLDQEQRGSAPYHTSSRGIPPPLVTTNFTVVDDGISSPRFIRATLYNVPATKDLLNSCRIPLGLVVQPMATIPEQENTIHLVDHGAGGPLRCNRCKTYMNPFVRFVDGGRQYLCPICQCSNEVPPEYFCHLDHKGMRTDLMSRPELIFGTVEYRATVEYCKDGRLPKAPAYIFLIDVSAASTNSGLLPLLSQNILTVLDHLPDSSQEEGSPILVGLATYDKVLHFYNLKPTLAQPGMMVVTDTADMFVPMVDGFLVNVKEARGVMESLLSQLPGMFSGARPSEVILEPAVRAGLEALKAAGRNGRLFLFHTGLPSAQAPGQLKNRLDSKLLGTDKEKSLLQPVNSSYKKLAEECVKHGVAVELFLTPPTYCDVATLGGLCSTTGGQLHLFTNYQTAADGSRLISELINCVSRQTGFDAVMRVRASTGLRPTGFYGAFFMQNTTDIELANIDSDKAIAVEIKHDDKLKEDENPFFQAALLYTTYRGERRLRIHNVALNCSTKYQDFYRSCEIDTIINFLSKSVVHASLSMPFKSIRETLTKQCAVMLACYRKQCSSQSPAGQLILPESLKLLPMYTNCILKSDCLLSPPILPLDEKCWLMYSVLSLSLEQSGAFFYPRMISLHDVDIEEKGLPPVLRCTGQKLQDTGVYAIENGFQLVVWVGQQVSHDFMSQVFGAPSVAQINTDMPSLPALDNPLSFRVRGICAHLQATRQLQLKLRVAIQRDKTEVFFRRMLKEDKGAGQWEGTNYVDFLCQIHRDIKELLN